MNYKLIQNNYKHYNRKKAKAPVLEIDTKRSVVNEIVSLSRKKRKSLLYTAIYPIKGNISVLFANDGRNKRRWMSR